MKKNIENGCTTTTTSAKKEVKLYVDLEKREISRSAKTLKHIDCILKENQPYYYVEYEDGLIVDYVIDDVYEKNKHLSMKKIREKAKKRATQIETFINPFDPSEYEDIRDCRLERSVDDTLDYNDGKPEDELANNYLEVRMNKATIIFDEEKQKYVLNIEEIESDYYTIFGDGEVEN